MTTPKLLAFAGSLRRDSLNKKLARAAGEAARAAGASVTILDLAELPMPLFDEDLERAGTPDNVRRWKELLRAHDGFLVASGDFDLDLLPLVFR